MSTRLATRIGHTPDGERSAGAGDVVLIHEPAVAAEIRAKGSLYLLAQISAPESVAAAGRRSREAARLLHGAGRDALAVIEQEYRHDLSGDVPISLSRAVVAANRRLYHDRARLGIPDHARIGIVAMVIHRREAYVARLGAPTAVLVRRGRIFELGAARVGADDSRDRRRRVARSAGEALEVAPIAWHGSIEGGDRLALVSRRLARSAGPDELKRALLRMRPRSAVRHLQRLAARRAGPAEGAGSPKPLSPQGMVAIEVVELPVTEPALELEPVHPAAPFAGRPDESPLPVAETLGRGLERAGLGAASVRKRLGDHAASLAAATLKLLPRRRVEYPLGIRRTDAIRDARRRRLGTAGMAVVAALVAVGGMVAGVPGTSPTDAIPRAEVARASIGEARALLDEVEARVAGADLIDRAREVAERALTEAVTALDRAQQAGVAPAELRALRARAERGLDRVYAVRRIGSVQPVVDLTVALDAVVPREMVTASDGSLWILETGRGRVARVDPTTGETVVVYRAGEQPAAAAPRMGDPWLIATAATDVVVVDRDRTAWRIDLTERIPRHMTLQGVEGVSARTTLTTALQHRPPLEIFALYLVDGGTGEVLRWAPPPLIPVEFPEAPEPFLSESPDLDPRRARDLVVDVNGWLLQPGTVTRIDFGTPRPQDEYSLDPPPDGEVRGPLDYRHLEAATVGERELLFVYDAGSARIIGFQRADGAFLGQWLARADNSFAEAALRDVRGLSIPTVADGPPAAYLLTAEGVIRLVLE